MSALLARRAGDAHPEVLSRRMRELALIGVSVALPLALGLAISFALPHPSFALLFGVLVGGLAVVALMTSERYELTVLGVAIYLGMLEGPLKLGTGAHAEVSVVRDVLIFAISLGAVLRLVVKKERIQLPPLSAWALGYAAITLVEVFNPSTHGILKALGGIRQQLEFLPFFFFGYALMRSKARFRMLFIVFGVMALANGVVSVYQEKAGPAQLASWGAGYRELVYGSVEQGETLGRSGRTGISGRTFVSEGEAKVRPPGLGTDAGFGGGIGMAALPGALALLAIGPLRRRWPVVLLCLGALLAVATGLGRTQVVGAFFAVLSFAVLALTAGQRVGRPLVVLLSIMLLALPLGAVVVSIEGGGTFSRYAEIEPGNVAESKDKKTSELTSIPHQVEVAPLGVGLGTVGSAAGFGGKQTETLEGHGVGAATVWKLILDELGLPGLLLWIAFMVRLLALALPGLRRVPDYELRLELAAVYAVFIASLVTGFSGETITSAVQGPLVWFTAGITAYWFAGPGRARLREPHRQAPEVLAPSVSWA
ncbi:MAG TPA: hypothetical protein VKV16_11980 [Solirubrobacteraceae bacterium]|nr:hypothetical protein [Solirubrobacteraceae bacterium]